MDLSGLTGEKLRRKVAEVIYYKVLTRMDLESKKTPALKNAVQPQVMSSQCDQILASPAFKALSDMPDKELRSLAARTGGEKLLKSFIRETAKNMKQSRSQQNPVVKKLQETYKENQMGK